jgi:hypothetical protein
MLPRITPSMGMKQVRGVPVSEADFRNKVQRHTTEDWLQTLGKMSRALDDHPPASGHLDQDLARYLGPHSRRALDLVAAGSRFVFQAALNTLAREALFWGADGLPVGFTDQGRREIAWALLGAVDLFDDKEPLEGLSTEKRDSILASLLLRRIARPYSHLRNRIPRTHRLFIDLPATHAATIGFDFDKRCRELCGVGIARYLAICFTFYTRFGTADLRDPGQWILSHDYYRTASSVSESEFKSVIGTVSATPDELRAEYENEIRDGLSGIDDHRPLVRRPICEVRPGAFVPIDFHALGERLVGDGVYWRLRPLTEPERSAFGAAVGRMLEEHLYNVLRDVCPEPATSEPDRLFRERRYRVRVGHASNPADGPDLVLFEDEAVMVCEVGANPINVRDTLHRGSVSSLDADIQEVLIPRAEQLHRKIEHMRSGLLAYERQIDAATRIEPAVCFLDGFPMAPIVRERIDSAIDTSGYLKLPKVGRLSILGAEDFEVACGAVEKHGHRMTDLLAGHEASAQFRDWTLADYVRDRTGELPITDLLAREFQRVTTAFTDVIRP